MFFFASKTLGLLIQPQLLALCLAGVAGALRLLRRAARLRRALLLLAAAHLLLCASGPVANLLLTPLESRYARPAALPSPGAIVMLGGVLDPHRPGAGAPDLGPAADRLVEAVRLARRYPRARLLLTGGSSELRDTRWREADALRPLVLALGVEAGRLLLDRDARNTRENALNARRLLADLPGPVVLVTSALHMPRAVACFQAVQLGVIPWPTDFRRSPLGPMSLLPGPEALMHSTAALREYAGLLAYWLAGYV